MSKTPTENELKLSVPAEMQAKFIPLSGSTAGLFNRIVGAFKFAAFEIRNDRSVRNIDRYFDSSRQELQQVGHSIRIRSGDGPLVLTIKKAGTPSLGIFSRLEDEREISQAEADALIDEGFQGVAKQSFGGVLRGRLIESLVIETDRRECMVERGNEKYKLCLDASTFVEPQTRERSSVAFEVEVEALAETSAEQLTSIRDRLVEVFPEFELGHKTKQTRGNEYAQQFRHGLLARVYAYCKARPRLAFAVTGLTVVAALAKLAQALWSWTN